MSDGPIYLDYAATTPIDKRVLAAMQPFFVESFYNPSATYSAAREVHKALEQARSQAAFWLGARSSEITFTAGATEANNLAIYGVMECYPEASMVVSAIEHESVLMPAGRYNSRIAPVTPDGIVDLVALESVIDDTTVLVSVMYANNEIGTVQPIREITQLLVKVRSERAARGNSRPLYLHSDAAQAGNYLDLHVARSGVDLLSINGSKIYGPKQSGLLYVKAPLQLRPLLLGGGQEHNLRSGTENVAGSIGLAAALDLCQQSRHEEVRRLQALQQHFYDGLGKIGSAQINGSRHRRLPSNVHVSLAGQDNERLLIGLDQAGIMAAAGSACSASNEEPSHVLRALGMSDELARASIRFTMGRGSDIQHIDRTLAILGQLLSKQ
jgi:cysteine desulfurase